MNDIEDIINEAGISIGLFYKYFKDKNGIYLMAMNILFVLRMEIATDFKYRIIHE